MKRQAAFTLIEILVAVAILAIALAATTRAASLATDGSLETRQRLLATWTAENRVAEMRARRLFPEVSSTRMSAEQAGMQLVIDETVSDTSNPIIRPPTCAHPNPGRCSRRGGPLQAGCSYQRTPTSGRACA